jgi:hypothetical protein
MTPRLQLLLRLLARLSSITACVVFATLAMAAGPPTSPEGPGIERDVQYVFVVVGIIAAAAAWIAPLTGGWLLIVTGVVLGIASAGRYSEETALVIALAYVLPGSLFLIAGTFGRRLALKVTYGMAVVVVMAYGGSEAAARHAHAFGPAHPQSTLTRLESDRVQWLWSGAVTTSGATVKARLAGDARGARLLVSRTESLSSPAVST